MQHKILRHLTLLSLYNDFAYISSSYMALDSAHGMVMKKKKKKKKQLAHITGSTSQNDVGHHEFF